MPSVYIETTIPSFYFETRRSSRVIAWREATRHWWEQERARFELVTSDFVLNELALAPLAKRRAGTDLLRGVRVLPRHPRLPEVLKAYINHRVMPSDAAGDAAHLAMTSLHGIDFLLTWNCKHLANANKTRHIRAVNERLGLPIPILTTPLELIMEEGTE